MIQFFSYGDRYLHQMFWAKTVDCVNLQNNVIAIASDIITR